MKGSEFVVWLPLLADAVVAPEPERAVGPPADAVEGSRPRRVLIVDDHKEVGDSLGRLVHAFGHEVAIARDGPSALALAESFQPNAAILDVSLQGMSGIELGRRLRQVFPRGRLFMIALTGFASADIREACFAAGFDAHLIKPGEIPKLEQLLKGAPDVASV
jgi:CheY-like chemotaxis protein